MSQRKKVFRVKLRGTIIRLIDEKGRRVKMAGVKVTRTTASGGDEIQKTDDNGVVYFGPALGGYTRVEVEGNSYDVREVDL